MDMPAKCGPQSKKLTVFNPDYLNPEDKGLYLPIFTAVKQLDEPVFFRIHLIMQNSFNECSVPCHSFNNRKHILNESISYIYIRISENVEMILKNIFLGAIISKDFNFEEGIFICKSPLPSEWVKNSKDSILQNLQVQMLAFYNPYDNMVHTYDGSSDNQGSIINLSRNKETSTFRIHRCGNNVLQKNSKRLQYINYIICGEKKLEIVNTLPSEIRLFIFQLCAHSIVKSSLQYFL